MTLLGPQPGAGTPDNVFGLITMGGSLVIRGSHECGKAGCTKPASVAVFGLWQSNSSKLGRMNVCTLHVAPAMRELHDSWICALVWDRDVYGEACPHCGRQRRGPNGEGHLSVCPIGLAFPEFAALQRKTREPHDPGDCAVCTAYLNRRPGPTG